MTSPFQESKKQDQKIEQIRKQEQEDLAKLLAVRYKLDYIDLSLITINTEALRLVPEPEARAAHIAVFKQVGKKLSAAILTQNSELTRKVLAGLEEKGFACTVFMAAEPSLEHAWLRYKDLSYAKETAAGMLTVSKEQIENVLTRVKNIKDIIPLIG